MALDPIKIAQMLRTLPDQQLAPLAQGVSPNVNPQEAQMEMMRRAQTRKAAQMGSSGIKGLAEGGAVWDAMSKKLKEEADRKVLERRIAAANSKNSVPEDVLAERTRNMRGANSEQSVPSDIKAPPRKQYDSEVPYDLAQKPKQYDSEVPYDLAQKPTGILSQNAGAVAPTQTKPTGPVVPKPTTKPTGSGISTLTPPANPAATPAAPTIGQPTPVDPFADFEATLTEKVQDQMKPFQQIFAARAQALESGKRDPLDMDQEKKKNFYKGLLKFGTSLLASNAGTRAQRMGMAFDQGVQAFIEGAQNSAAAQEEIRKESLDIALKVQDNMLAEMGMSMQLRDKFSKELMDQVKERREIKKDADEARYKEGVLENAREGLKIQREGIRSQERIANIRAADGGSKEKDRAALRAKAYQDAMKQYEGPQYRKMSLEEKDRLAQAAADKAVNFALGNPSTAAATPSLEELIRAELARRSKQ